MLTHSPIPSTRDREWVLCFYAPNLLRYGIDMHGGATTIIVPIWLSTRIRKLAYSFPRLLLGPLIASFSKTSEAM